MDEFRFIDFTTLVREDKPVDINKEIYKDIGDLLGRECPQCGQVFETFKISQEHFKNGNAVFIECNKCNKMSGWEKHSIWY